MHGDIQSAASRPEKNIRMTVIAVARDARA